MSLSYGNFITSCQLKVIRLHERRRRAVRRGWRRWRAEMGREEKTDTWLRREKRKTKPTADVHPGCKTWNQRQLRQPTWCKITITTTTCWSVMETRTSTRIFLFRRTVQECVITIGKGIHHPLQGWLMKYTQFRVDNKTQGLFFFPCFD